MFRARVVNPRWIDGDAPARLQGRLRDGRDRRLPVRLRRHRRAWSPTGCTSGSRREYVLDDGEPQVHGESNPWALHGIAERLLEAAGRGMWAQPEPATLDGLRAVLLETEGELEG